MQLVTIDFETFYDVGYSLNKLTTEEYIRDPRFQVIGVGIKIDDGLTHWHTGTHKDIHAVLDTIDWRASALVCHNTMFFY